MSKCLIQLSKNGDLCSLLPILHHDYLATGVKSSLIVSNNYRRLPESVDYLKSYIYPGRDMDLAGAIKWARINFDDVRIPQLHGTGFEFRHFHPSFQYDQWDRAGALAQWDKLPLVLPRPKKVNVEIPIEPYIIFADHSQSSPFFHKEDLYRCLVDDFPKHKIVRMSEILVKDILDLLPLYDAADLIISVDTLHLHLAKATETPLIALVSDTLSRWHGSAFSHRFALHVRYKDYYRRKHEILRAGHLAINKKSPMVVLSGDTSNKFGYNLSTIWHGEVMITTHRYHPKRHWKTNLAINDGAVTSDIIFPEQFKDHSAEDARLFHHNGKLMISYVLATTTDGKEFRCVVGYGMLVQREGRWYVDKHFQPQYEGNDFSGMVKNWCPFEHDGRLFFIWGIKDGEQVVIEVEGDKVVKEHKTPAPTWNHGEIRGGAIVRYQGSLLRFFHSRSGGSLAGSHGSFQYHVGASVIEPNPPFKTVKVSHAPIVSGDERYVPGCFHWKGNVAIPYGAIHDETKPLMVSLGRNDSSCEILRLHHSELNLD